MDLHITGIQLRYHCPRCLGTFPWWEEGYFIFIYHSYSLHLSESEKCIVYTLQHWKLLGLQTKGDLIFFKTTFFFWFLLLVITPFTPLTSPLPFIPALLWIPRSHATSKEFNKIKFFTFLLFPVLVFYCCCTRLPQLSGLKQWKKSKMVPLSCLPPEGAGGEFPSLPFVASSGHLYFFTQDPFLHLECQHQSIFNLINVSSSASPPSPLLHPHCIQSNILIVSREEDMDTFGDH